MEWFYVGICGGVDMPDSIAQLAKNCAIDLARYSDTKPGTDEGFEAFAQWQLSFRRLQRARAEQRRMAQRANAIDWWFRSVTESRMA